jgi:hypothetical protein
MGSFVFVRALVTAVSLLLFLSAGEFARGSELLRCELSGLVLSDCCCPSADHDGSAPPSLSQACCCKLEKQASTTSPSDSATRSMPEGPRVLVSVIHKTALSATSPRQAQPDAQHGGFSRYTAPPRAGPPLVIAHRRLLI